jgi:predicted nucleic acid-binding protein
VPPDEAAEFVALLRDGSTIGPDPPKPIRRSADPGDDYLIALAEAERGLLVTGDQHLLASADQLPIQTARGFLDRLT